MGSIPGWELRSHVPWSVTEKKKKSTQLVFSIFTELCKHYHNLSREYFHHPKETYNQLQSFLFLSPFLSTQSTTNLLFVSIDLSIEICLCVVFYNWVFSLSNMHLRSVHVSEDLITHPFLLLNIIPLYRYTTALLRHLFTEGHLSFFQFFDDCK